MGSSFPWPNNLTSETSLFLATTIKMAIGNRMISVSNENNESWQPKYRFAIFHFAEGGQIHQSVKNQIDGQIRNLTGQDRRWMDKKGGKTNICSQLDMTIVNVIVGKWKWPWSLTILFTHGQCYDPLARYQPRTFATSWTIAGILGNRIESEIIMEVIMDSWIWWGGWSRSQPRAHLKLAGHLVEKDMIIVSNYGQC